MLFQQLRNNCLIAKRPQNKKSMLMKHYLRGTNLTLPVLSLVVYLGGENGKIHPPLIEGEILLLSNDSRESKQRGERDCLTLH
jgi:hypothetical protein